MIVEDSPKQKAGKLEVDGWKIEKAEWSGVWYLYHSHPEIDEPHSHLKDGWVNVPKNYHDQYVCSGCMIEDLEQPPAALIMQMKLQKLAEPHVQQPFNFNSGTFYLATSYVGTASTFYLIPSNATFVPSGSGTFFNTNSEDDE